MGIDVHVIVGRDGDAHLKFSWKVLVAIDWLLCVWSTSTYLVFLLRCRSVENKYLVPGRSPWQAVVMDFLAVMDDFLHDLGWGCERMACTTDVPRDITTSS